MPPPSTTQPLPRNCHPRHTGTTPPGNCSTYICRHLNTVLCDKSTSSPRPHAQAPLPPRSGLPCSKELILCALFDCNGCAAPSRLESSSACDNFLFGTLCRILLYCMKSDRWHGMHGAHAAGAHIRMLSDSRLG